MRKITVLATIAAFAATLGVALADGGRRATAADPASPAISIDAMKSSIEGLGYDIRSLKEDDGVFKVRMFDRASGGAVKAKYSIQTGELMGARPAR